MGKKAMESLQDLIEEAKLRTVWWMLCIFAVSYFLTHTSKSMLMNIPIAILFVSGLRILFNEVDFRWKARNTRPLSYLLHLERKQLSVNDSRLTTLPPIQKWKRKIDSPAVEEAIENFISKILQDFVLDLWYSDITPDKEAPELIHEVIVDVLGEVSGRVKEVNLVDLLTRDVVDLIGDHLDLFRRNQAGIGVDVMAMLSSEERDDRLKHHLLATKELHPALISSECEYKVLQQLVGGLLAAVLRPREAQCPLVRCIARELLTCLVMLPIMDFASPGYINELIECIVLAYNNEDVATDPSPNEDVRNKDRTETGEHSQSGNADKIFSIGTKENDLSSQIGKINEPKFDGLGYLKSVTLEDEHMHPRHADWAKAFEAATQRRTEVLTPENLENMWAIGRNYKKKLQKTGPSEHQAPEIFGSGNMLLPRQKMASGVPLRTLEASAGVENSIIVKPQMGPHQAFQSTNFDVSASGRLLDPSEGSSLLEMDKNTSFLSREIKNKLKRSNSTSDLKVLTKLEDTGVAPIIAEYCSADAKKLTILSRKSVSDVVLLGERLHVQKLRSRVIGASSEGLGSNSFAVYLIVVTDASDNTWSVKRRYRNFERLHRHLKDIPNYTLHLPPKRIFSSSTEDSFVHQRSIQLDKYLQDVLSIANVAEQHEVWDFFSASSKNYSYGKPSSTMRTLAVNVDDAVDDIVRQFKGVSDGLIRKVVGPPSSFYEPSSSVTSKNLSWNSDDINKLGMKRSTSDSINSFSDDEERDKDINHERQGAESTSLMSGCHSDNELNPQGFPQMVVQHGEPASRHQETGLALISLPQGDLTGVPLEWTPTNLSVPVLNLVDNIFQLNRRGWLRRQVFWISKQILQLVMEDALDDWLAGQIQWLRREDVIAQGIKWVQDVLWPDGVFFTKLRNQSASDDGQSNNGSGQHLTKPSKRKVTQPGSFEQQFEATRRANDVKKMLFNGAPTTLVSLIGHKQYRRCARDLYYFLQSEVCLKQLGYGILELVLLSLFPEMRETVKDIHEKMHAQHV